MRPETLCAQSGRNHFHRPSGLIVINYVNKTSGINLKLKRRSSGAAAAGSPPRRHPAVEGGFDGAPIRHVLRKDSLKARDVRRLNKVSEFVQHQVFDGARRFCEEQRRLVNRISSVAADEAKKSILSGFPLKPTRRLRSGAAGRFLFP